MTCQLIAVAALTSGAIAGAPSQTPQTMPIEAVMVLEVAGPDYDALWEEDVIRDTKDQPWRFAVPSKVDVTPFTSGTWSIKANGRMLWQLRIVADQALHINLGFDRWTLPSSAQMWMTSFDGTHERGPWDARDNAEHGELWSPFVWGDDLVLEIEVDASQWQLVEDNVHLAFVNVGYRGFAPRDMPPQRGSSESCNVDVVCPLGDAWWDEIPSVGVYTLSGYFTCTGSMINNTAQDERNLFLTAQHCGINTGNDQTMVVYWNHQNSSCRTGSSSGGNGNGNYNQYSSGATYRTSINATDCCLVEMNTDPNSSWGVTYSGWSRTTNPTEGVGIHHPETAEKRISSVQNIYTTSGQGVQYWGINWDEGRTAPGSSGSPLYDANYRIIGQLYGGWSYCTNDDDDVYGRSISYSWNSLKTYLDPTNSNATYIDSLNPSNPPENGACCLSGGQCLVGSPEACDLASGTFQGAGSVCGNVDCDDTPPATGACCVGNSCAGGVTSAQCSAAGGTFQGEGSDCSSVDCGGDPPSDVEIKSVIAAQDMIPGVSNDWTVDIYAVLPENWRVDAVAGTSSQLKTVTCSTSFYQDTYGGPTSADVNPAFYNLFPSLQYDSRVTIGALDSSGDPFGENALQQIGINWDSFEDGGDLSVNNGTWFILPTDAQGDTREFTAGDCSVQHGVLIARLTPVGHNATVTFDGLVQGRNAAGSTWQGTASSTVTWSSTQDCNMNSVPDSCDIANGTSQDSNGDGVPDECGCPGDLDGSGNVNVDDLLTAIAGFGGQYNVEDLLIVLAHFGEDC